MFINCICAIGYFVTTIFAIRALIQKPKVIFLDYAYIIIGSVGVFFHVKNIVEFYNK